MKPSGFLNSDPQKLYDATCPQCKAPHKTNCFFRPPRPGEVASVPCDGCRKERKAAELKKATQGKLEALRRSWEEGYWTLSGEWAPPICPQRFLHFERELYQGLPENLDRVLGWEFGPRGLVLHGGTGKGKTYLAFYVGRREHFQGRRVAAVNGRQLRELVSLAATANDKYTESVRRLSKADLLIVNDPFKSKLTEKYQELLWDMVDERYERELPIILTMNGGAKSIEPMLSHDRAKPIFRRLREENQTVYFP